MNDRFNNNRKNENNNVNRQRGRIFQDESSFESYDKSNSVNENNFFSDTHNDNDKRNNTQEVFNSDNVYHNEFFNDKPEFNFQIPDTQSDYDFQSNNSDIAFEDISSNVKVVKAKKKKGKSRTKKFFISLIAIVLVVAIGLVGYGYNILGQLNYQPETHQSNKYVNSSELNSSSDVENILILGTDKRESQANFRSDTMMLLSIDKKNKALKLTSFLRDSWVYIPAKDKYAKLNAACSYGGAQMVIDTIEYNYKVKIDNYIMIDFDIFKSIINDIGGITLTITEAEAKCITREAGFNCKSGTRHVKGRTALWYARIRHLDSDFNRTARQRKVISAIVEQVKKCSISTLVTAAKNALPQIQTDIDKNHFISLGIGTLLSYMNYDIVEQQIPAKGTWRNANVRGQAVLKFDKEDNVEILKEFIYEKTAEEIKSENKKDK